MLPEFVYSACLRAFASALPSAQNLPPLDRHMAPSFFLPLMSSSQRGCPRTPHSVPSHHVIILHKLFTSFPVHLFNEVAPAIFRHFFIFSLFHATLQTYGGSQAKG